MLRIPWTMHIRNEEVLRRIETTNKLLLTIRKEQLKFLGHNEEKKDLENNTHKTLKTRET